MSEIGSSTQTQNVRRSSATTTDETKPVQQAPKPVEQTRDSFERSASSSSSSSSASQARSSVPDAGPKPSDGFLRELYGDQSSAPLGDVTEQQKSASSASDTFHLAGHSSHSHGGHDHAHGPAQQQQQGGSLRAGAPGTWPRPADPPPPTVTTSANGQTTVNFGGGNDNVRVRRDGDGSVQLDEYRPGQATDGSEGAPFRSTRIPPEQAGSLRINGNDGDDNIEVDDSFTHGLTIDGGRGNDRLVGGNGDDTLIGGEGNDHLEGRGGNDRLDGGAGDDFLYGGEGNDQLEGGAGNDWLHGGDGNDVLHGGAGNDQLFGGRGNDRLSGGDGDDMLAGGEGDDVLDGGRGRDRVYVEGNDRVAHDRSDRVTRMRARGNVGQSVQPEGSARFQQRMRDDLDALASVPEGRELLRKLDATGRTTRITEARNGAGLQWDGNIPQRSSYGPDGRPGPGVNPHISMQDRAIFLPGAGHLTSSAVILAHELAHAYDMATGRMNGTASPNPDPTGANPRVAAFELDAVGLPHSGPRRRRPAENDVRRAFNMPRRAWY